MTHAAQAAHAPRVPIPGPSEADLRRGFEAVLSGREAGTEMWGFAYGAPLWEREFARGEGRVAALSGLAARHGLWDERNRGTPERRSFTLGLRPGEGCAGATLHLAEAGIEDDFWKIWRHEMPPGYHRACRVDVRTGAGPVRALTFVADAGHPLHAGDVPEVEGATVLAPTSGQGGTAAAHPLKTVEALRERGVPDPDLGRLQEPVVARARTT